MDHYEPKPSPVPWVSGKVVMVTGASSGIGKAATLELARLGARVIMVCRNPEKGQRAKERVVSESGNSDVELMICDLSLMSNVRRLASEFTSVHPVLNVLVNNAGSVFQGYHETSESLERTMALNYFSPFLLTNLLLPALKAGAPSRVVNVSSASHFGGSLDLGDINGKKSSGRFGLQAYGRSKLALVLFTYELSKRLSGAGVAVNCLHPGAVRTNIWAHSGFASPIARFASLFMRSPEKGAETVLYLASSPDVEGVTGEYYFDLRPRRSSTASYDESLARDLWRLSEGMMGIHAG
jgi:NAD(P)-dependent dehydrogenase (short-subunit alcohol dehydrogenase family)